MAPLKDKQAARVNQGIGEAVAREQAWEEHSKLIPITRDTPITESYDWTAGPYQILIKALQAENQRILKENADLKRILARQVQKSSSQPPPNPNKPKPKGFAQ